MLVLILSSIALSVIPFTPSAYSFGIFQFFLFVLENKRLTIFRIPTVKTTPLTNLEIIITEMTNGEDDENVGPDFGHPQPKWRS